MRLVYYSIAFLAFCITPKSSDAGHSCTNSESEGSWTGEVGNSISDTEVLPRCVTSIENQLNGRSRPVVHDAGAEVIPPAWFNATLATIGQRFANKYWFSTNLGMIMAELAVVTQTDRARTIYYSGGVNTPKSSVRRFSANILQHSVWYEENFFSSRDSLLESLNKVRSMHAVVSARLSQNRTVAPEKLFQLDEKLWSAVEKDLEISNIQHREVPFPEIEKTTFGINQFGLTSTLWGLAAMPVIRPQSFGIPAGVTDEEIEGFLHLWAFVGHSIGVENQFNVCLQPDAPTAKLYFERFLQELILPFMLNLSYEAKVVIERSSKSFYEALGPIAQFDFILRRVLEDVVGIPCPNLTKKMSPMGKTIDVIWRRALIPALRTARPVRSITNFVYNGYIQNLCLKVFGFDGTNKTIVSEKAFSW